MNKRNIFKSKKVVYVLVLSMGLSTPMTAYASSGEATSFYEKVKTFIFGEEEVIDKEAALIEFRRQFNAGNNNVSQVLGNTAENTGSYSADNVDEGLSILEEPEEEIGACGTMQLEGQIPFGPYNISESTEIVHQNYGFGEGQTSETNVRVDVKLTSSSSSAYSVLGATMVAQGEHSNIWVVNPDEYYSDMAQEFTMTADELYTDGDVVGTDAITANIATSVDVIYRKLTSFAPHAGVLINTSWYDMPEFGDADNDGRVNVILYDIGTSGLGGYFWSLDYYLTFTGIPIDAIHVDVPMGGVDSSAGNLTDSIYKILAHEFQHLLFHMYFDEVTNYSGAKSNKWLNEGISVMVESHYSDHSVETYPDEQNTTFGRILYGVINSYENGTSYGDFMNFNNSLKNYGINGMLNIMLQERDSLYLEKVYEFFISNLVEATEDAYAYSRDLSVANYSANSSKENWGELFRNVLGDSVDTTNLSSEEVLEYVYTMFMESYMSAGGQVINGDLVSTTYPIWKNGGSLWSFRNGNNYYFSLEYSPGLYFDTFYTSEAYDKINSGGDITLVGYPSDSTYYDATHEMAYTLETSDYDADDTNVLCINIPETDGLKAYVALYDASNANPIYGTSIENENYDPTKDTADLYPIELGADNYVTVDSDSIVPHLFVFTYYSDVEATVIYDWVDEIPDNLTDISTVATMALTENTFDFDNTAKEPTVTVSLTETSAMLTEGKDYTVTYTENTNAGQATVTIEGMGDYKGSISTNFDILPISIVNATIIGISNRYSFTGMTITPPFTVVKDGRTLVEETDYTYTFNNNTAITKKGYVTVEGVGNYKESVGAYFEIYN